MPTNRRKQLIGRILFSFYLLLYCGFVLLVAFDAERLQVLGPAGGNLAVWAGCGRIGVALVLSLIYGWVCRTTDGEAAADGASDGEDQE